jgi:sec-independent protein translocase protein TatA
MLEGFFQPMHLMVVLAIVLIVFGPGKLPEVGSALGEAIRNLKKAMNDIASDPTPPAKQQKLSEGNFTRACPVLGARRVDASGFRCHAARVRHVPRTQAPNRQRDRGQC